MKINWRVRFQKSNLVFILRFLLALLIPVLTYLNLETKDLTSWDTLFNVLKTFISNPYLIGLVLVNAINLVPDPTSTGIGDSQKVLKYTKPNNVK